MVGNEIEETAKAAQEVAKTTGKAIDASRELGGFFVRIFGGQVGVVAMSRFLSMREKFHSNMLGLHVQTGSWLTDQRLQVLSGSVQPESAGPDEAYNRALEILTRQVRAQAYTMAVADGFILIGWMAAVYLLLMLFMRPGKFSYKDLRNMQ